MNAQNANAGSNGRINPAMVACVEAVHMFLQQVPAEEIKRISWEMLNMALTSNLADESSANERAEMLSFHSELCDLAISLKIIDEQLRPWIKAQEKDQRNTIAS